MSGGIGSLRPIPLSRPIFSRRPLPPSCCPGPRSSRRWSHCGAACCRRRCSMRWSWLRRTRTRLPPDRRWRGWPNPRPPVRPVPCRP